MISVSRTLRREGEQVVCALAAALLLLFLASWGVRDQTTAVEPGSSRITESPSVFGPGAFAFLQDADLGAAPARNPFLASSFATPVTRPEKPVRVEPPKVAPPPEPQPQPPVAPAPEPKPPPEPVRPAAAALPARRLGACDVKYVFSSTNRSGRLVALIELRDPARPAAEPLARNVSVGEQTCGLRIQSCTDQALTLVDAAGRRQSISFGGTRRVTAEVLTAP
jgi:hypothetical protein